MGATIALGFLALLAVVSGLLKLRERMRSIVGALPGLVETLAGSVLGFSLGPNMASESVGLMLGAFTLAVLVLSNVVAFRVARKHSAAQADSEGARLYSRIKYQAALDGRALPGDATPPEEEST